MISKMESQNSRPIAVFDSGMGGISVLKRLKSLLPNENYLFFADSAHAPYGIKPEEEIKQMTLMNCKYLVERDAKAIVIACNTATAAAINAVKSVVDIPVIGIEPAIEMAVSDPLHQPKQLFVMATPYTLSSVSYQKRKNEFKSKIKIIDIPAPKIVECVEKGDLDSDDLIQYLESILPLKQIQDGDGVVLGCTHFPFVQSTIKKVIGKEVVFYDGALLTAKKTKEVLSTLDLLNHDENEGFIVFENSESTGKSVQQSKELYEKKIEIG